ncbi:MAG: fumarylacetoacetate hydrolase family protein [Kiritimatiellae bacterium]|nr:fumarylacetoacetate hydrolase family protein [Kiritimatiellia bacterium]
MRIARVRTPKGDVSHALIEHGKAALVRGDIFGRWERSGESHPLAAVKLLAPVAPPNILCLGRNYKAHAEESGDDIPKAPLLFIKATTSVIGPEDTIRIPVVAPTQVDYEAELAVVIGKTARKVAEREALGYVLGYTCGHDVSARDCQAGDGQWARAKSFDSFCPLGPWIETELNPASIRVQGRLNGATMQDANTSLMIFNVAYVISYLSRCMTLLPGTVLMSGTPAGVGFARKPPVFLKAGDVFEVEIEGIGTLRNQVADEVQTAAR